jgi:hypothetical integral membrane protein (TIGR02206 family)
VVGLLARVTWLERFRPFTTLHLLTVLVLAGVMTWVVWRGWTLRGTPRGLAHRRLWGWSIAAVQVAALAWWLWPGNFRVEESLPLHLCRLGAWVAALAMLTPWRWALTLTYFWGLGLCLQGFITPLRFDGLKDPEYWIFWLGHAQIVGTAIYGLVVMRYRPRGRDYLGATGVSLAYVGLIVPTNMMLGTDYGYLGAGEYRTRNIIDLFGPWPQRAVLLYLAGQGMLTLLYLVWLVPWPGLGRGGLAASEPPLDDGEAVTQTGGGP